MKKTFANIFSRVDRIHERDRRTDRRIDRRIDGQTDKLTPNDSKDRAYAYVVW